MPIAKRSNESVMELNFSDLFEQAPVAMLVSSLSGEIVKANKATAELLGYDQKELLARHLKDFIFGEDQLSFEGEIGRLIAGTVKDRSIKIRCVTKDNRVTQILYTANLFRDQAGTPHYIHENIVEMKLEISNKDSEIDKLCFNAIIDSYPEAIYFKNKASQFLKVNKTYINRYKIENLNTLIGKSDLDIFTDEHALQAYEDEQQIIRTGVPYSVEEKETNHAGVVTWASAYKMPLRDEHGNIVGTFGISKDITEEKLNESGIKEKTNILKAVTSKMPIVIYKFDKKQGIHSMLGETDNIKVFEKTKVVRLSVADALFRIVDKINSQQADQGYFNFLSSLITPDGERNFENFIFENENTKDEFIGLALDVTERKRNQQNLKRNAKSLEKINKELNQFAYIISHDLKAPLRAIINLSEWIKEDLGETGNDDVKENLRLLSGRVQRMENLINGILAYSRVSRVTINYEDINVGPFLKELVESLMLPEKYTVKISDNLPTIYYPQVNLDQVFTNLISNAAKYNLNSKGTIEIGCRVEEGHYEFWVADDGPGIAPEYHEKIFQIFQTLQARDSVESTGIGLTIVKKIIEERGGSVWVESELGKGSKFIFTVPIKN